ncbi:hypothetical protein AX16_010983 [Volvariella volvacea WC 439]|nr:hypothetical protein AX16_010983 [Volvariella volvacea WC 439]
MGLSGRLLKPHPPHFPSFPPALESQAFASSLQPRFAQSPTMSDISEPASPVGALALGVASDEIIQYLGKNFTAEEAPAALRDVVILGNDLFVDCIDAGKKVGINHSLEQARSLGLIKNHWLFRICFLYGNPEDPSTGQVQFGMNVDPEVDVGSLVARYIGSSRSGGSGSGSFKPFSDVGSVSKPPELGSDDGSAPLELQSATAPASEGDHSGGGSGSGDQSAPSIIGSDQFEPPLMASSLGGYIGQPTEGAPVRGIFNLKVRGRATPSDSALVVFRVGLRPRTTFGELLTAIIDRNVEPFHFRFINFAYLGCRDFITQIIAWLLHLEILVSTAAETIKPVDIWPEESNIFGRLQWRYKIPDVVGSISDAGAEGDAEGDLVQLGVVSIARSPNPVDRAWWPENYTYCAIDGVNYTGALGTTWAASLVDVSNLEGSQVEEDEGVVTGNPGHQLRRVTRGPLLVGNLST